jgi:hypothetical protein
MAARKRPVLRLIGVAALALACAGPASAASPQKIYKDLADNGKLDGRYSRADIARAFNLERVVRTDAGVPPRVAPRVRRPAAAVPSKPSGADRTIPFTGFDLALLTVGGGPLLLIGLGLRRRLAPARDAAEAARG